MRLAAALLATLGGAEEAVAASAPPARVTISSPAADAVSLTVYRAPDGKGAIDLNRLGGFALITETRRLRLPRGPATIRFEGVSSGIVPVSAIVSGLPGGTIERNQDARLLSPASLVDGTLGRDVTLTRIDRATGRQASEAATIIAGPQPGIIFKTASGIEALRCSGLSERFNYPAVPPGLSARPVLSVTTDSPTARTVSVQISYLASGLDWRASYVATLEPAGDRLDLFAWMTLANGNAESFPAAQVQAVAGRLNRVATFTFQQRVATLRLSCFPLGTTTSVLKQPKQMAADEIVVTGSRMFAPPPVLSPAAPPAPPPPPPPEDLGDLKLYSVPGLVAVNAHGQKQVALLARSGIAFERRYRRTVRPGQSFEAAPTSIMLLLTNESASGLGIALPAGDTALYAPHDGAQLLLGVGSLVDRAIGEKLRLDAGISSRVLVSQQSIAERGAANIALLTATNANPFPVTLEVPIGSAGQPIDSEGASIARVDGVATWTTVLAPNARVQLRYRY